MGLEYCVLRSICESNSNVQWLCMLFLLIAMPFQLVQPLQTSAFCLSSRMCGARFFLPGGLALFGDRRCPIRSCRALQRFVHGAEFQCCVSHPSQCGSGFGRMAFCNAHLSDGSRLPALHWAPAAESVDSRCEFGAAAASASPSLSIQVADAKLRPKSQLFFYASFQCVF